MTKISKKISRETGLTVFEAGKEREIVVTIEPPGIVNFRAKGCRRSYQLPSDALYWLALKADVIHTKRMKSLKKANRSKAKRQAKRR